MQQPVPDRMLTKLRYSEQVDFPALTRGALAYGQYRNSLFDPDVTYTGHQQLWRDQMATLYKTYRVLGIKYKFTFINQNQPAGLAGAIRHSSDATAEISPNTLRERNNSRTFIVGPNTSDPVVVKGYMPVGKPHGLSKRDFMADEDFEALFTANPVKQTYLEMYLTPLGPTAIANCVVDLVYYVLLTDRINVTGS